MISSDELSSEEFDVLSEVATYGAREFYDLVHSLSYSSSAVALALDSLRQHGLIRLDSGLNDYVLTSKGEQYVLSEGIV